MTALEWSVALMFLAEVAFAVALSFGLCAASGLLRASRAQLEILEIHRGQLSELMNRVLELEGQSRKDTGKPAGSPGLTEEAQ